MNYSIRTHPRQPLVTARIPTGAVLQAGFGDRQTALDTAAKLRRDVRAGNGIRRVKDWQTVHGPKQTWRLRRRKVKIRLDDDGYRLVIDWSARLRLESIVAIENEADAVRYAKIVQKRSKVQLRYWCKEFVGYTAD